jgi:DNA-binding MarR family transcriptional regulator
MASEEPDQVARFVAEWQDQRPDLDPWPLAILGRVERIATRLVRQSEIWLRPLGLGWESFCLLVTLRRSGPPYALRPTDLYRESLLSSGAMTNRIDRVAELGWVVRRPDPDDGRAVMVQLTEAGLALADQAVALHFGNLARLMSGLETGQRAQLASLLAQLLVGLEADASQAGPVLRCDGM